MAVDHEDCRGFLSTSRFLVTEIDKFIECYCIVG